MRQNEVVAFLEGDGVGLNENRSQCAWSCHEKHHYRIFEQRCMTREGR